MKRSQYQLEADPFADFAELYELTHRNKEDDIPFYLEFAERVGAPILDIGCGTGRVTMALAQHGYSVTGIDLSENMLNIAREKLHDAAPEIRQRIVLYQQDMSELTLENKNFPLALMPYGEFAHVMERSKQEITLQRIAEHLATNGLLIIGMSNWDPREARISYQGSEIARLGHSMPVTYEGVFDDPQRERKIIRYLARGYDPSRQTALHVYIHEITDQEGRFIAKKTHILPIRYIFRYEMELLLEKAGFTIENIYGYYDKSEFKYNSKRMIFVARKHS